MSYKLSKYNSVYRDGEYVYLVNYLNKKIARTTSCAEIDAMLSQGAVFEEQDSSFVTQLLHDGFIVSQEQDEDSLARVHYLDTVYDKALNVTLLVSESCNLRCSYCYESFALGNMKKEVADSFQKYLSKNLKDYSKLIIDWFGGEPLLAADEIDRLSKQMIGLCQTLRKPYYASMTTNGYLLDADMMKRMLKNRVYNFQVTLDGTQEIHDSIRKTKSGGPTFFKIISNLREIRDQIHSKVFSISIRVNVTKPLLPKLGELLSFLHDEFSGDSRFSFYFRPVGDWGGSAVGAIKNNLVTSLEEFYEPIVQTDFPLNVDVFYNLLMDKTCVFAFRNSYVVDSVGDIFKCTLHRDKDFCKVGTLSPSGTMELDQGKVARWVAPEQQLSDKCHTCQSLLLCQNHTCPAKAFFKNTDPAKADCGYEHKSLPYILKLLYKYNSAKVISY